MKRKKLIVTSKKYIAIWIAAIMTACVTPEIELPVSECAPMPCDGRASACACALQGKAYVFGGRNSEGVYLNDLWEYDAANDTWTNLGTTPLKPRVNATMIAYEGKVYVGLGYSETRAYRDTAYLRDWWTYDPQTNQWNRLTPYPSKNTISTTPYVVGDRIYAIYGATGCFTRDITWYDTETDSWHQEEESHLRAKAAFKGVGAEVQGQYYYGLGFNTANLSQWYRVDLPTDSWTKCKSMPGKGRTCSTACATNQYIYVFGGRYFGGDMTGGEIFETYMRYSPDKDTWAMCGIMPCGRAENQVAFSINGHAYFGLGENEKGQTINKLYRIED